MFRMKEEEPVAGGRVELTVRVTVYYLTSLVVTEFVSSKKS